MLGKRRGIQMKPCNCPSAPKKNLGCLTSCSSKGRESVFWTGPTKTSDRQACPPSQRFNQNEPGLKFLAQSLPLLEAKGAKTEPTRTRKDVNLQHHLLLQKKQRLPSAGLQPTATKGQKTSAVEKPKNDAQMERSGSTSLRLFGLVSEHRSWWCWCPPPWCW